jgi:2-desacetyl-2-hydroxyethyl bacteriochlorophyllide A dehydrogenase
MKAAVWKGVKRIDVEDREIPKPKANEMLVKIGACGVCGTDVHIYHGNMTYAKPPVVLGHEFAGKVVEVGSGVKDITEGDLVAVDPNASCNHCYYCRNDMPNQCLHLEPYGVVRDGGFEEYCAISEVGAVKLGGMVSAEEGSFIEPLSCVCHAFDKLRLKPTHAVSVIGCGTIGLLMLQMILAHGVKKVICTDIREGNLKIAKKLGASHVFNPKNVNLRKEVSEIAKKGVDLCLDASGNIGAIEEGLGMVKRGGTMMLYGNAPEGKHVRINPVEVLRKEITITGSWLNPHSVQYAVDMLEQGRVDVKPLITNTFSVSELVKGIELMKKNEDGTVKVLIKP